MKSYEYKYIAEAVRVIAAKYPIGHEFTMTQFINDVKRAYPWLKHKIFTSFDRRLREIKVNGKRSFPCINKPKSLYKKIA